MQKPRRACVFAHYDPRGEVADYVLYYLDALASEVEELVLVSTAALNASAREQLARRPIQLIVRENRGYDFCSYRAGIDELDVAQFDELVICNDSVFGPFRPLSELFRRAASSSANLLGLTASTEIAFHLQSYFLVFRSPLLSSTCFTDFWKELEPLGDKQQIIEEQEVGLTQFFLSRGYTVDAIYDRKGKDSPQRVLRASTYYGDALRRRWRDPEFWRAVRQVLFRGRRLGVNPTHADWRYLLEELAFPFLKIELLRDNPKQLRDLDVWPQIVASQGGYPVGLIRDHLKTARGMRDGEETTGASPRA